MTNRFKLPVVVTTTDELTREEVTEYVERVVSNLEETDIIYRTYVADSGIDQAEGQRLLEMLDRVDDDSVQDALDALDRVTKDDDENS